MTRLLAFSALALTASCMTTQPAGGSGGSLTAPAGEITVSDAFDGSAIAVARGGTVKVELVSAAGAPFEWVVVDTPAFLRLTSSEKIAAPQPANGEPIVGGPVTNRFIFQATGTGTGRLRFALRSFVDNREVARHWTGTITIR